jgi:hypothetical protein
MKIEDRPCRQRVLQAVNAEKTPQAVEHVRASSGLVNWESTKAILMELVLEGEIKAIRGSNGWLFYRKDLSLQ